MDPGRKKIEDREGAYIAVGDRIVTEHGVDWMVARIIEGYLLVYNANASLNHLPIDATYRCRVGDFGPSITTCVPRVT